MNKGFARRIESFVCEICGMKVDGTGYTNHCPRCLSSKHVDVNPGDRQSKCKGIMMPVGVKKGKKDGYVIKFRCVKCGCIKRNKASKNDNFNKIVEIMKDYPTGGD